MASELVIGHRRIALDTLPYLIAEIGVNHENNFAAAELMIGAAARAGAEAVKFQVYRADWLASQESPPYWNTDHTPAESQWALFHAHEALAIADYARLAATATACGVAFLCSAFDLELIDQLDPLVPAWKIASGDLPYEALVRHIASKGKPVLLSTGASTIPEIRRALCWLADVPVALLHCNLAYPTPAGDANLLAIRILEEEFGCVVGWSDHVAERDIVALAYMVGARIIEKHFTLDRSQAGNDHYHAWDPEQLAKDVVDVRELAVLLGQGQKTVQVSESLARVGARRSLHVVDGEPRMLRPAR